MRSSVLEENVIKMSTLEVQLNNMPSDWQVARALLEDEYTSLHKTLNKFQNRYEFAQHLLDVHRMWCLRQTIAWSSRCLPERSDGQYDGRNTTESEPSPRSYVSASTQTGDHDDDDDDESSQEKDEDDDHREEESVDGWIDLQDDISDTHHYSTDLQSHFERTIPDSDLHIKQEVVSDQLFDVHLESSSNESTSEERHEDEIPTPHSASDVESHLERIDSFSDIFIKQEEEPLENQDLDVEMDTNELISHYGPESISHQGPAEGIETQHIGSGAKTMLDIGGPSRTTSHSYNCSSGNSSPGLCDADGKTILDISRPSRTTSHSDNCSSVDKSPGLCDACISSHKNVRNPSRSEKSKLFQCKSCSKTYFSLHLFHLHMTTHNEPKLQNHRRHTREKPQMCSVCGKNFITKTDLAVHMRTHTRKKPFECNSCSYRCSGKSYLTKHMRTHTGEKPFECNTGSCSYRCSDKSSLRRHMRIHTGEKAFECNLCSYRSSRKTGLTRHMRTHTGEKPFKCSWCTYRCSSKNHLTLHMRRHTGEKPFECSLCSYRSSDKSHLTLHMRTHTGEKPFECSWCTYRCSSKNNLTLHMRTHTGEKPFECSLCSYRSSRKGRLTQHMRTHTGEKPFECNLCSYRSSQKSQLTRHMRTHTGEKPFQ